ncbi:hypothetical protein O206_13715 [Ochrobactrum sp. EGD-AQ16]|nr:hypothetical protein O206_13715 [Ochrobactrum sp. EGD-AQ16]
MMADGLLLFVVVVNLNAIFLKKADLRFVEYAK